MLPLWVLNAVGLCIGIGAAVLMYYFPPRVVLYTEKGEPYGGFVGNPTENGKLRGKWQIFFAKIAPWLLALGFLLQLVATVAPAFADVPAKPTVERDARKSSARPSP